MNNLDKIKKKLLDIGFFYLKQGKYFKDSQYSYKGNLVMIDDSHIAYKNNITAQVHRFYYTEVEEYEALNSYLNEEFKIELRKSKILKIEKYETRKIKR